MLIDCPKINSCFKIRMILDHDLVDFQYAEAIKSVCERCVDEKKLYPEIQYSGRNGHDVFKRMWPDGTPERLPLEPSLKLANHSPTGYSWSYGGSGTAQLSLALLLDATSDPDKTKSYYQEFKWSIVAGWGREWTIFRSDILSWLKLMEQRELKERQGKN